MAGIASATAAFLLWLPVAHQLQTPIGSDAPVYLWWTRAAGVQGLSLIGTRSGVSAAALVMTGTLHDSVITVISAMQYALGVCVAMSAAALARSADDSRRSEWILAGLLVGAFTVHLVSGYLSNLAFAALFIPAGLMLAAAAHAATQGTSPTAGEEPRRDEKRPVLRATISAGFLLSAGGLTHPQFFAAGALVLIGVAGWRWWRGDRSEIRRIAAALGAAAILYAGGLIASLGGPPHLAVDTSRDGFLRRAGMGDALRSLYFHRFVSHATRYVQELSVPLAIIGWSRIRGEAGRFVIGWAIVTAIAIPVGLVSGWFPADRMVTFGYCIPILAAFGLVRVVEWIRGRLAMRRGRPAASGARFIAVAAGALLGLAMFSGAAIAYARQSPFVSPLELERAATAARIAETAPAGTPLVFIVDDESLTSSFLATRAANVIRAAMPPELAGDVYIYVGSYNNYENGAPTVSGATEFDTLSRLYMQQIPKDRSNPPLVFLLAPFDRIPNATVGLKRYSTGVFTAAPVTGQAPAAVDPIGVTSPASTVAGTVRVLLLLTLAGLGWARAGGLGRPGAGAHFDRIAAISAAPAFGLAAFTLGGIATDALGIRLGSQWVATVVALVFGGGGYLVSWLVERKTAAHPAP